MLTLAVPIYNMELYLPRCMDTLLGQTCRDFEILLIDDGSTDGSSAMCDAYQAACPDFVRVIHKPNGGLSSARNAGIDAARGEYIIFPDPDDWVEPDYVEKLLLFREQYRADMVCTGYYVDTDHHCTPAPNSPEESMTQAEARRALLLSHGMKGFAWNKLYRLDIIRENQLRFLDDVGTTEDLDFSYRYLGYCQQIFHAPGVRTYHYYQRDGAATGSGFSSRKLLSIRTYEKIVEDCIFTDPELAQAAQDEICTAAVNLLWMYENAGTKDTAQKKILLQYIRKNLPGYLLRKRNTPGRKIQAVLAGYCPTLYRILKNAVHN